MSIEIFSREALYTATRGLDNAFRALFPDGDSNPVIWQFTPHDAWKRTNWEFNPVTFYDDCIVDGKMVWGNVGVTYHVLHEWHTGHKVDSRCRYWRFLAGPDRGPLAPLLAKIHKLGRLRKHLRRCLHITRQIMKKVIGATPAELQFASAIHHIEWAPWVADRKLRRLPVDYSPIPSNGRLFTTIGPTHEATVTPPSFQGLTHLVQQLAPSPTPRVGRPRREGLEQRWEEAQQLYKQLGSWADATEEYNRIHNTEYEPKTVEGWGRDLRKRKQRGEQISLGKS